MLRLTDSYWVQIRPYSMFLKGPFAASFSLIFVFATTCPIKVFDGWIRTRVLWYQKRFAHYVTTPGLNILMRCLPSISKIVINTYLGTEAYKGVHALIILIIF